MLLLEEWICVVRGEARETTCSHTRANWWNLVDIGQQYHKAVTMTAFLIWHYLRSDDRSKVIEYLDTFVDTLEIIKV